MGYTIPQHLDLCGFLDGRMVHCVDSTELAVDCQQLLAKLKINGQNIRIYCDIDCDCGKRRNKRDKSVYVVGYRMHTLAAINAKTGQSFPLISLLAPANHHDSLFLGPLVSIGKAIGLDLQLITADEAYHDNDGAIYDESGVQPIPFGIFIAFLAGGSSAQKKYAHLKIIRDFQPEKLYLMDKTPVYRSTMMEKTSSEKYWRQSLNSSKKARAGFRVIQTDLPSHLLPLPSIFYMGLLSKSSQ